MVILQNQNSMGSVCNWAKPPRGIMHFSLNRLIRVGYIYIFFCHTFSFLLSTRQAKVLINNNQLAIVPKILGWDQLWIINRLLRSITYIFFCHFTLCEVIFSIIFLIDISFFTTFINIIFSVLYLFFVFSTWINQRINRSPLKLWPNHLKRFSLIFSSIRVTPIFKRISLSWIQSTFLIFSPIHLNILINFSWSLILTKTKIMKEKFNSHNSSLCQCLLVIHLCIPLSWAQKLIK